MTEESCTWDIVKATQYGVFERCKEIVASGFDVRTPDADNITILHWAAINNRLEIARYYISEGAVVDVLGGDLMATPLHWAIREGHLQMVVLLMRCGADPAVRDSEGCAALHVAVQCGFTSIVSYLIAKGTDPNLYDGKGKTALMWAAMKVFGVDPTRALISLYANVNQKDFQNRNTPLHWACTSQNTNVITLLIKGGADLDAINAKGETPLDIAQQKSNNWIVGRIKEARKDQGLDLEEDIWKRFLYKKSFQQKFVFLLPFFVVFLIGIIFEAPINSWLLKLALILILYGCLHGLTLVCVRQMDYMSCFLIAISCATKFWTYFTSIFFYIPTTYSFISLLFYFTCSSLMLYFFYKVVKSDPGFIAVHEDDKKRMIVHMAETNTLRQDSICSTCLIAKPLRSKHCSITNKCVARYDHYCPWVLNAIGSGNHHYFVAYLASLFLILFWHVLAAFRYWSSTHIHGDDVVFIDKLMYQLKATPWVNWIFINTVFHLIWVTLLLLSQLYQMVWLGLTTNERINAYRYEHFKSFRHSIQSSKSPFDRGILNNAADLFQCSFGSSLPPVIDWRTKMAFAPDFPTPNMRNSLHETV